MPLACRAAPSRFCDGKSYAVLYAARTFETAFIEVVVRDRFVRKAQRTIPYGDLSARSWICLSTKRNDQLSLLDLRETGCLDIGAPTDTIHARNHSAGRTLALAIYQQHHNIDGFLYRSRLTNTDCFAVYDRAASKLVAIESGALAEHQDLSGLLETHKIELEL